MHLLNPLFKKWTKEGSEYFRWFRAQNFIIVFGFCWKSKFQIFEEFIWKISKVYFEYFYNNFLLEKLFCRNENQ